MLWAKIRGLLVFTLAVGTIAYTWQWIEARPVKTTPTVITTSTTTTAPPVTVTTTTTPEQAVAATCARTEAFLAEVDLLAEATNPGPLARLALSYWSDLSAVAIETAVIEIDAVVRYYQSYIDIAEPHDFNTSSVILEGDKEKFEQLLTRPAQGLEASRGMVSFLCGVEVPDKPWMGRKTFANLEERLFP